LTRHESENAAPKAPDLAAHRAALKPTKTNAHKDEVKAAELTELQQVQEAILNKARKRSESGPV
jgi:hypothetical protein